MPGNGPYLFDRIAEFTTTEGTGPLALAGAIPGDFPFSSVLADNAQAPYVVEDGFHNIVEWGVGTYRAATNTWERTSVEGGHFGNQPANLLPGTKHVWIDAGSKYLAQLVAKQGAGTVLAGPVSGADALAQFHSLVSMLTPSGVPNITGSRGGNAALASLLTALAGLSLITDSTTA